MSSGGSKKRSHAQEFGTNTNNDSERHQSRKPFDSDLMSETKRYERSKDKSGKAEQPSDKRSKVKFGD